jgi:hypothetical protein
MTVDPSHIWNYREPWTDGRDIAGFEVEAIDGSIGHIDEAASEADASHIVVDTGFWIFGKKILIPAGAVTGIDFERERVMIDLTKDHLKDAPDFDRDRWNDASDAIYRSNYNEYYGPHGW